MWWRWLITSAVSLVSVAPMPRARVLFFVATDCPYSDRYFPEMLRLEKEFGGRGVTFLWVYPNRDESLAAARAHQQAFGASPAAVDLDAAGDVTRQAGVHITPEAAVLAPDVTGAWSVAYHGRIDDRYVRIGLERAHVTHHDLEDAISAVMTGRHAQSPAGPAVGCAIVARHP